ncbi:glycosyltransferase family 4 protein [Dysgonomonas sp.]
MDGIIFWTGCINLHTFQVFEQLGVAENVIVAYCVESFRGFSEYKIKNVQSICVHNKEEAIDLINDKRNWLHINNAFKVEEEYEVLNHALKYIFKNNIKVMSLFQEQYPYWGIKGYLRRIKWGYTYNWGLGRKHIAIGCCGNPGITSLKKAFVSNKKLFEFIYTPFHEFMECKSVHNKSHFVVIGQLVPRKAIMELIDVFQSIEQEYRLVIIGGGELEEKIKETINNTSRILYKGKMSPEEIQEELSNSDVLLLPSIFDGWGCTTNEAIVQGCRVIVSDSSGSHSIIKKNRFLGQVFKNKDWAGLRECIMREINKGPLSLDEKSEIRTWANKISPEAECAYLKGLLNFYINNNGTKPTAPWNM